MGNDEFGLPLRVALLQLAATSCARALRSTGWRLSDAAGDAREAEQVVDQLPHALRGVADPVQIVVALLVQLIGITGQQGGAKAVHGAQRGAQVVRDGVGEGFQFLVGGLELGGALLAAPPLPAYAR